MHMLTRGAPARRVALVALGASLSLAVAPDLPAQAPLDGVDARTEARVDSLVRLMTVEEKVGEMTQLTIQAVSRTQGSATVAHQLDPAKLEEALVRYNVGSLLNVWDVAFTPQHWQEVTSAVQRVAQRKRLKIPVIYGIDAVHGFHYMVGGTIFPQNLAMAATWNPELVRRSNEITARETRAAGIPWNFSPVLDLARQPLWSRFFETFGEDVYLATVLGVAAVEGQQQRTPEGHVRVAATGKHFLGYSMSRTGKDRTTAWIPERQLREYFLPTFKAAVDSGLLTVMINSGDLNGVPVHASREILTGLLREELGFRGIAVTDWEDIVKLHTVHRVAATPKDAVRISVMAGIDMSMVPYNLDFYKHLVELVREGAVPQSRLDESVRRILRVKYALGLFDNAEPDARALAAAVGAAASHAVSRAAAEEAITLLKNDRALLPLAKSTRVLVTGPGATSLPALHGSWTYTWQGTDTLMYPKTTKSVLETLRSEIGAGNVTHVPGATMTQELDVAAAVAAARAADVAIVCLAEQPSTEQPGDIDDLTLPAAQLRLARAVEAAGKPVVLVLTTNRPRIVREVVDSARAVVATYETGPYGGEALADVLFGDVNPSGRLPFTYPRYAGALVHYDRANSEGGSDSSGTGFTPQWQFGHGLSYTTFGYSDLRLDRRELGTRDTLTVSVTVANTGKRAGKEVVQLYVRDLYAAIAPAVKRLRGFDKVALGPGERRTVTFKLPVQRLAFIGLDNRPTVEPGEFQVMIGGLPAQSFRVR